MTSEYIDRWVAAKSPNLLEPLWKRFRSSPVSVRLARGVFWSLLGSIISRGLGVVGSILVARVLGMTAFGEFTAVQSTVGLFGTFAGLGLGVTATKYVAELRESQPARCGRVIGLILAIAALGGVMATLALIQFSDWFATHALASSKLGSSLRWGSGLILFSTLQGVYSGALGGFEAFRSVARFNWTASLIGTPLMVAGAYLGGLQGAMIGSVAHLAVTCVIGHCALLEQTFRSGIILSYAPDFSELGILWRFSLPAFLSSVLTGPANWACNTLLVNQDQGYQEIALLNAAGQWKNFLSFLPLTMTTVLVPMFASLYHSGRIAEFQQLLRRQVLLSAALCLLLAAPLCLLSPVILDFYGPGFRRGMLVFVITLSGTAAVAASNLMSRAMQSCGRAWLDLAFSGLWTVVLLGSSFLLVPTYKAVGIAIAHILAVAALGLWQWLVLRKLQSGGPP